MLSTRQRQEILDALQDFNNVLKKYQVELQEWERSCLALNMAICTCLLQEKVLKREAVAVLQRGLDQIKHYAQAKKAPPLLSPTQLTAMIKQEKGVIEKKLAVLESIVDTGEEHDIRSLYNEIKSATSPDDDDLNERLAKVAHIMGWIV